MRSCKEGIHTGVTAFAANVIIIGILGTLLLVAYSKVGAKSGSLSKED